MIYVKFKERDLRRWLRALNKVRSRVKLWGCDEMQRRCAVDYYQLVVENIMRRKHPIPPYSEEYRKWKRKYGRMGYPSPWRLFGDLIRSLSAFRYANGWMGGVPPGLKDTGGKLGAGGILSGPTEIVKYGSIEEARRPLFEPTMKQYAASGWRLRGKETLQVIRKAWR